MSEHATPDLPRPLRGPAITLDQPRRCCVCGLVLPVGHLVVSVDGGRFAGHVGCAIPVARPTGGGGAVTAYAAHPMAPEADVQTSDISALYWCRYAALRRGEPVELVALYPGKAWPRVAYATSKEDLLRLMREGDETPGIHGVYVVANQIVPAIAARYELNRWNRSDPGRANDSEILSRRVLYIDIDSERPRGISATDAEKTPCYAVADQVEAFLRKALGDPDRVQLGPWR